MSRQSEKFLIEQSRKFLLTAFRGWKDGTNRDEPRGTGLAGLVETGQRRTGDAEVCCREDGNKRSVGASVAGGNEGEGRCGGGPRLTRTNLEPAHRRRDSEAGDGDC